MHFFAVSLSLSLFFSSLQGLCAQSGQSTPSLSLSQYTSLKDIQDKQAKHCSASVHLQVSIFTKVLSLVSLLYLSPTISTSYIGWLRSLPITFMWTFRSTSPKPITIDSQALTKWGKPLLVFGLCAVVTTPRPVGSATSLKILGVVLELRNFSEVVFLLQHQW